jgi:DeoR/GlpR family transcriptional regulator of sugar metabolism
MGAHGLDPHAGLTSPNLLETEVNAAMVKASGKLVVLADSSKYGLIGLAGICPLSAIHTLVTDSGLSPASEAALRQDIPEVRKVRIPDGRDRPAEPATAHADRDTRQSQPPAPKGKTP